MYACVCKGITEAEVRRVLERRFASTDELIATLGLADSDCCGRCRRAIRAFFCPETENAPVELLVGGRLRKLLASSVAAQPR